MYQLNSFGSLVVILIFADPSKDAEPVTSPVNVSVLAVANFVAVAALPDIEFAIVPVIAVALPALR